MLGGGWNHCAQYPLPRLGVVGMIAQLIEKNRNFVYLFRTIRLFFNGCCSWSPKGSNFLMTCSLGIKPQGSRVSLSDVEEEDDSKERCICFIGFGADFFTLLWACSIPKGSAKVVSCVKFISTFNNGERLGLDTVFAPSRLNRISFLLSFLLSFLVGMFKFFLLRGVRVIRNCRFIVITKCIEIVMRKLTKC
jgi:hypothetical protein